MSYVSGVLQEPGLLSRVIPRLLLAAALQQSLHLRRVLPVQVV